jgi:hypothetical protein
LGTASERFGAPFKNLNAFLVQEPDARGIGDLGFHKNSLRLFFCGLSIIYHFDVDILYATVIAASYRPDTAPRDAEWGERFFHLTHPDGHEPSFAWPLR